MIFLKLSLTFHRIKNITRVNSRRFTTSIKSMRIQCQKKIMEDILEISRHKIDMTSNNGNNRWKHLGEIASKFYSILPQTSASPKWNFALHKRNWRIKKHGLKQLRGYLKYHEIVMWLAVALLLFLRITDKRLFWELMALFCNGIRHTYNFTTF